MRTIKFFPKSLYGYGQLLGGGSNLRINKKTKQAKKGMGMTGFFDMDVETIGLTLTTKLCKDMHKCVYKD